MEADIAFAKGANHAAYPCAESRAKSAAQYCHAEDNNAEVKQTGNIVAAAIRRVRGECEQSHRDQQGNETRPRAQSTENCPHTDVKQQAFYAPLFSTHGEYPSRGHEKHTPFTLKKYHVTIMRVSCEYENSIMRV